MDMMMEYKVVDKMTGITKHIVSTLALAIKLADEENAKLAKFGYDKTVGIIEAPEGSNS